MFIAKFALCAIALVFFIGLFSTAFPFSYSSLKATIAFDLFGFASNLLAFVIRIIPNWVIPSYLATFIFFITIRISIVVFNKILDIWRGF